MIGSTMADIIYNHPHTWSFTIPSRAPDDSPGAVVVAVPGAVPVGLGSIHGSRVTVGLLGLDVEVGLPTN